MTGGRPRLPTIILTKIVDFKVVNMKTIVASILYKYIDDSQTIAFW
jgi:hypothetical protein